LSTKSPIRDPSGRRITSASSPIFGKPQAVRPAFCPAFFLIFSLELAAVLFLAATSRVVRGHDGFVYFGMQYFFLNEAVVSGAIPQWIPYMTQGLTASVWYVLQAGLAQNVFLVLGPLLKGANFLLLFHAGIFADRLVLLLGVWLLGRRFFQSAHAILITASSIMASAVWMDQPWFNFHLYYALPLVLELTHRFLDTCRWRYAFLACFATALQTLGNLPYFLPVFTLVVFLYFLFYLAFHHDGARRFWRELVWGWPAFGFVAGGVASFLWIYLVLRAGTGEIVSYHPGRGLSFTASVESYLTYGEGLRPWAVFEVLSGVSPAMDYTLYVGILPLPLVLCGLVWNLKKEHAHFWLLVLVLTLIVAGTALAAALYYLWPGMKYFRHLVLLSPLARLFVCFLAGFGWEGLAVRGSRARDRARKGFLLAVAGTFVALTVVFLHLARHYDGMVLQILPRMTSIALPWVREAEINQKIWDLAPEAPPLKPQEALELRYGERRMKIRLAKAAACAAGVSLFLAVWPYLGGRMRLRFAALAVFLHLTDVYGYYYAEASLRTVRVPPDKKALFSFQAPPYTTRRDAEWHPNGRSEALFGLVPFFGLRHWAVFPFLFRDELGMDFKTQHWLAPLDRLIWAYLGTKGGNPLSQDPLFWNFYFPKDRPAVRKMAGVAEDKIQFFFRAHGVHSDDELARLLADPDFSGDLLFLSLPGSVPSGREDIPFWTAGGILSSSERVRLPYEVEHFSANKLALRALNDAPDPVWLYYSDVWQPLWKADVNGKAVTVYRAHLAYKAVKLEPGWNRVRFDLASPWMGALRALLALAAALGLTGTLAGTARLLGNRPDAFFSREGPGRGKRREPRKG
jgi:hypothetical protein